MSVGRVEQIVGPEPREATFASSAIRLSCSVAPWPGQLRRYPALLAMSEYRSSWWSIDLLSGWAADEQVECVAFVRDDGVGALQISSYEHDSGTVPAGDLDDFTEGEFPDGATLEPVTCGVLSGVGVDYVADGNFWLKRWLHKGTLLVYATYNCDAADRDYELPDVNRMLATLKSTGAG